MSVTDVPLAVLRFQYQMARVPFQVMEEQFVARMDPQAPARLIYERRLGALDTAAGMVLGDPELEQRGAALAEHSDALGRVAQLDATATEQQEQAADELKSKRDQAKQDLNDPRATKQRKVTAAPGLHAVTSPSIRRYRQRRPESASISVDPKYVAAQHDNE